MKSTKETFEPCFWLSGCGGLELEMTLEQAQSGSHQGRCDEDIAALMLQPDIKAQLDRLNPALVFRELKETGAWKDDELLDWYTNLQRILWIACGSIVDEEYEKGKQS